MTKHKFRVCYQTTGNIYKKGKQKCVKASNLKEMIKKFILIRGDEDNVNIKIKPIIY